MMVYLNFIAAFLFVIALITLSAWVLKKFVLKEGTIRNGLFKLKDKRIGIIEAIPIDTRRKLVLIKQDDKQHLLLVGGPNDLVIETNITSPLKHVDEIHSQKNINAGDADGE